MENVPVEGHYSGARIWDLIEELVREGLLTPPPRAAVERWLEIYLPEAGCELETIDIDTNSSLICCYKPWFAAASFDRTKPDGLPEALLHLRQEIAKHEKKPT